MSWGVQTFLKIHGITCGQPEDKQEQHGTLKEIIACGGLRTAQLKPWNSETGRRRQNLLCALLVYRNSAIIYFSSCDFR